MRQAPLIVAVTLLLARSALGAPPDGASAPANAPPIQPPAAPTSPSPSASQAQLPPTELPPGGADPVPPPPEVAPSPPMQNAPSPSAPAPAGDAWSAAIGKGLNKDEDEKRKDEGELSREEARRLEETEGRWRGFRERVRFSPYVGAGFGSIKQTETMDDLLGPQLGVGAGIRVGIGRHFDFQARVALNFLFWNARRDYTVVNTVTQERSSEYGKEASVSGLGFSVDTTVRWLPGVGSPRWYLGLGPRLALFNLTGTSSGIADVAEKITVMQGLLESGVVFGGSEEWDLSIRGHAGIATRGQEAVDVVLALGRAF